MTEFEKVSAFAPVNIAWIKYMGKKKGRPSNSSLSLTLATLGTHTQLSLSNEGSTHDLIWDRSGYIPPLSGQEKVRSFLFNVERWSKLLGSFGFECHFPSSAVSIETQNNVPAGTGIATSASGFSALTLAWSALLTGARRSEWIDKYRSGDPALRRALANVSSQGSGSSCRSFDGPWVEWNPEAGIRVIDGGAQEWIDFVLLLETSPKDVPSSEAHQRIESSPQMSGRIERVESRLTELKDLITQIPAPFSRIRRLVLDEALDMHDLFHTSVPSFRYMNSESERWVSLFQNHSDLPTQNAVITLDAGANVHLFVPFEESDQWESWLKNQHPSTGYLKDATGYGADYE